MSRQNPATTPVALIPAIIQKPWGQEVWLTGMEARGESQVMLDGQQLPLSTYLALDPAQICQHQPIVLLKILDPDPRKEQGNLYFEVHEHKHEVYLVTQINESAWPGGIGAIRYGMNQQLRAVYDDDDAFKRDYINAVNRYEAVRRALDQPGSTLPAQKPDTNQPHAEAHSGTPGDLVALEAAHREAMYAFTQVQELRVGDIVRVPPWLPHSLQHGVQVVEFQTPTYERYILSFEQRTPTQDHWDTALAVANMSLDIPSWEPPKQLAPNIESIVEFADFNAWRIRLSSGESVRLPDHPPYLVCMGVQGSACIGSSELNAGEGLFVPHGALPLEIRNEQNEPLTCLVAAPGL